MDPQELRIGNYYLSTKFKIAVRCTIQDFYELCVRCDGAALTEGVIASVFEPILLTSAWLVKFKWEKAVNGWWDETECFSIKDGMFRIGTDEIVECKYVHQLQDIYYALQKEQLQALK